MTSPAWRSMSEIARFCLVLILVHQASVFGLPPPTDHLAGRLGIDLNEAAREVNEDGTLDLLESFTQGTAHSSSSSNLGPTQHPIVHSEAFREHSASGYDTYGQHAPYQGELQQPSSYHYTYLPTVVYQPVLVPSTWQRFDPAIATHTVPPLHTHPDLSEPGPSSFVSNHFSFHPQPHQPQLPHLREPTSSQGINPDSDNSGGRERFEIDPDPQARAIHSHATSSIRAGKDLDQDATRSSLASKAPLEADPFKEVAGRSSSRPLLPAPYLSKSKNFPPNNRRYKQFPNSQKGIAERDRFDPELLDGSDVQISRIAVHDPNFFSGAPFRFFVRTDPVVGSVIQGLRSSGHIASGKSGSSSRVDGPSQMVMRIAKDPDAFVRRYFWLRKEAKQVLLQNEHGSRSLFLIFHSSSLYLPSRTTSKHVGVWEIGRSHEQGIPGLYFRGFYPFSASEFLSLEQHPEATGRSFWFTTNRLRTSKNDPYIALTVVKVKHDEAEPELTPEPEVLQHPDMQNLVQTGALGKAVSLHDLLPGKHSFMYQESPDTAELVSRWESAAGLPGDSFSPIQLTDAQVRDLSINSANNYRKTKPVKVVVEANGEMFMLTFFKELSWLTKPRKDVVSIWKIGPQVDGRRLMIGRGFFHIKPESFERLTPATIPGLRDASFHYNLAQLPGAEPQA